MVLASLGLVRTQKYNEWPGSQYSLLTLLPSSKSHLIEDALPPICVTQYPVKRIMRLTHMPFEDIPESNYSRLQWVVFQLQTLLSGKKFSEDISHGVVYKNLNS